MKNNLFKILLTSILLLISTFSYGQILKGTGLVYTNGVPTHTPRTSTESEYAVDVSTGKGDLYLWNRASNTWTLIGEGIDVATNANVPSGAPGYGQSRFRINTVPTLYFWTGIAWVALNSVDTDTNIYNSNGTITNSTRTVSIPGNLIFSNNSAGTGEKLIISYDNGISSNNNITVQEGLGVSIISTENNILLEGQTSFRDVLSPSALTGNVNNYSGLNGANVGILSSNGTYNITGIDNGIHGRILFLFNSGSFDLTLKNQDGASSTENQFYMGSDYVLKADTGSLIILYDTLIPAWRVFKFQGEGGVSSNIYTDNGTTSDNTRTLTITETLNFTGINDLGDPIPFQVNVTGNEPQAQLWDFGTDSLVVGQSDTEIYFKTNTNFLLNSDASLIFQSDSVLFSNTSVENVPTVESILGFRNIGGNPTLKQVVGTQTGHVLVWDEPNQIWELDVVSVGGGDDWGAQYVQTDSSLQGRGLASNPLTITGYDNASNGQVPSKQTDTLVWITPLLVEVDGSTTNEIQQIDTFEIVSNVLRNSLSLDGVPFKSVDLSPYLDNTDAQNLTVEGGSAPFTIAISGGSDIDINSGTGINLTESPANTMVITNSLPDVTVSLTDGGGIGVSGTYPNFTLTATDPSASNEIQQIDTFNISAAIVSASLSLDGVPAKTLDITESVQDIVGGMVTGNTETGITVNYDDSDGTIDFVATDVSATNEIQRLDTFEIVSDVLRASLLNDGVPFSSVDLTPYTVNIFNSDGTQDDADRLFIQDSTRTFAMGQFTSVSTPTWGRGYYYDPSTSNGIRVLNKDGSNTTTAIIELDPETINTTTTHTTSSVTTSQSSLNENSQFSSTIDRTSDTYGSLILTGVTNSNEELVALLQNGKGSIPTVSMYLGDGYSTSQYGQYADRAWGVQTNRNPNPGFDWIQILLPDTATDTTGNNINFYNRKYYWSNSTPSSTNGIMSFHRWTGNGTTTSPGFITMSTLADSILGYNPTIYTADGTIANREVELDGTVNFNDVDGDAELTINIGDDATGGTHLIMSTIENKINFVDGDGISTVSTDGSGVEISTSHVSDPILLYSAEDIDMTSINITGTVGGNVIFGNNSASINERFVVAYDNGVSSTNYLQVKEGAGILLQSSENNIVLEGQTLLADVVSPTTINSNQNNYTGLNGSNFGRLDASTAVNVTGFDNGYAGRILPVVNISSTALTFTHNATSSSENRYLLPNSESLRLNNNDMAFFIYDTLSTKWRLLGTNVGSPYTNSGRLLNGRSDNVYIQYQTDTLNDFALGYFTNGTTDDRITYGKFGLHIDGAAGFNIAGKETYTKGTLFNLLGTSYITANGYGYEMSGLSRVSSGSSSNTRVQLTGNTIYDSANSTTYSENEFSSTDVNDLYNGLIFGTEKRLNGVPKNKMDYAYMFQGGGFTGADTSAISMWLGRPQYTDTVTTTGGTRAISKERGWGVQSIFYHTSGITEAFKYDWIKAKTGSAPADTAVHSNSNDGITFYGNSYELPNQVPSSTAGDTSVMIWVGGRYGAQFIDIDDIKGGGSGADGNGIYGDGTDNSGDDDLPTGGSQIGQSAVGNTLRMVANTGNTTLREMVRLETVDNAFTRFLVLKGPTDSLRMFRASAGRKYTMQSYGGSAFEMASDSILSFLADSVLFVEGTVQTKTKVKFLLGMTTSNYVKRLDGGGNVGDIMVSDGTDWTIGLLSAHESNTPSTIRPSQLAATTNDYNPTGYSTTKTQYMEVTGDGSFRTVTGLTAATRDGVTKTFANTGTNCYVLAKEHTGSSAANRFKFVKDVVMLPGMEATIRYDSVNAYWRLVSTNKNNVYYGGIVEATTKNNTATVTSADNAEFNFSTNGGSYGSGGGNSTIPSRFFQISTSSAATTFPTIQTKNGVVYERASGSYIRVAARIRIEDLPTAAEDFDIRMGFEATVDTTLSEGAVISYQYEENSGGFTIKTHDGASPTTTNAGSAVAADTWYNLELIYYPYGEVTAFINGTRYTTTATLPEAITANCYIQVDKDNGASARLVYVTQFEVDAINVAD